MLWKNCYFLKLSRLIKCLWFKICFNIITICNKGKLYVLVLLSQIDRNKIWSLVQSFTYHISWCRIYRAQKIVNAERAWLFSGSSGYPKGVGSLEYSQEIRFLRISCTIHQLNVTETSQNIIKKQSVGRQTRVAR